MRNPVTRYLIILLIVFAGCNTQHKDTKIIPEKKEQIDIKKAPFVWEGANVYFLLTDRFNNGDPNNDINFNRTEETAVLRGFKGGDLAGITQKIEAGYFSDLGINAIWFTPVVEQVHGSVDEGTGLTYGFHGYWTKDWTQLDPNFGTMKELKKLVETAHNNDIRIIMDVVLNHHGPVTAQDPFWGTDWARQAPACNFQDYDGTTACTLVKNLPDILSESTTEVELPEVLVTKWKKEGRYDQEVEELNTFFATNALKKTPRNYIVKWLTDYIRELGIDGYRVDTTKHVEEEAWVVLRNEADKAFAQWKSNNVDKVLDDNAFFMFGEVYNYSVNSGRVFDFGDRKVDYFTHGFDNLINFQFKYDALGDYESIFAKYDSLSHTAFKGKSFMNYATSHDDGSPFDKDRTNPIETGTKLLLTPGLSQVYYGDESARDLTIKGAQGDATLRSFMNWSEHTKPETATVLEHWKKIGKFRGTHPAIGAGRHQMLSESPYIFGRTYQKDDYIDQVIIGLDLPIGIKEVTVGDAFAKAETLTDTYSGQEIPVINGKVTIDSPYTIVLLED